MGELLYLAEYFIYSYIIKAKGNLQHFFLMPNYHQIFIHSEISNHLRLEASMWRCSETLVNLCVIVYARPVPKEKRNKICLFMLFT